ncbi:MAG: aldehyde dehydrogenase family protein, partial [Phycisphaeraceae bacterium]|nr:aldehyde dehydrogenase family protein [Phycisphaeraceae bacterium]
MNIEPLLKKLRVDPSQASGSDLPVRTPIDGSTVATLAVDDEKRADGKIAAARDAFAIWSQVPPPRRGELVRRFGLALRDHKEDLAQLVTVECGKILEEARGEVQEMIDICDFAVGLSRQLHGLTIASERSQHVMSETWLPLGPVGVISAFNFPVAVWSWNAALALVCGDPVVWKPSEKTPLCALATEAIFRSVCDGFEEAPQGLVSVLLGGADIGGRMVDDQRLPLISATGSCRMGAVVGPRVAARFGRSLLELGGNNAIVVSEKADLDLALGSILFGAVGTAGQRCTTTRRLFVHRSVLDDLTGRLKTAYASAAKKIGDPRDPKTLIGPLIDRGAYDAMQTALKTVAEQGGEVLLGGRRVREDLGDDAWYVEPALVRAETQIPIILEETFAPILYLMPFTRIEDAIRMHNDVPQGLSSAIFTTDVRNSERFLSAVGSDCGIANVNIGTSGAEIGGAFGGEKET